MKLRPNRQLNYSFKGGDPPSRIKKPSVTIPAAVDHQRTIAEDILVILPIFVQLPDFRGWARTTPIPTYPSCLRLRLQPLKEHDLRTREGSRRTEGQIVLNWLGFNCSIVVCSLSSIPVYDFAYLRTSIHHSLKIGKLCEKDGRYVGYFYLQLL